MSPYILCEHRFFKIFFSVRFSIGELCEVNPFAYQNIFPPSLSFIFNQIEFLETKSQ
jgi:hypothetical protein